MFKFWKKKQDNNSDQGASNDLTWNAQAEQALEQAVAQAPVPGMLKNRLRNELSNAAEAAARQAGHSEVTAEDLMNGLMAKLPPNMKGQIEDAMKKGPEGLKDLEKKFKKK